MNDLISDSLTRIRNSARSGKGEVEIKLSKSTERIAKLLENDGYLTGSTKTDGHLKLTLNPLMPITQIIRISKPGVRRYAKANRIPQPRAGFGLVILTTPKGIMTGNQAKKQKVGGEVICEVW